MGDVLEAELEQLGFDLDDISATISMVEGHRHTFQLSDSELSSRKRFVSESRRTLEELLRDLRASKTKLESDKKALLSAQASGARSRRSEAFEITLYDMRM